MAESGFTQFCKKYLSKIKAFLTSKNALTFLFFLLMSASFWFINALGKEQSSIVNIPIRYAGVPQDVVITNTPPKHLRLTIRDKGKNIINYSRSDLTPLTIDLDRMYYEKGEFIITSDQLSGQISRYMSPTTVVTRVRPDSIIIEYEKQSTKKVPVKANIDYELERQYMLSEEIIVEPGQITVFGPKRVLDTLSNIYTEHIQLKKLNDSTVVNAKLQPIESVRFSNEEIRVIINVEMFTEKQIQVPITVINAPGGVDLKTFPAVVNVKFNVGLTSFNSIVPSDIKVILDYKDIQDDVSTTKVKLKFESLVSNLSNVQLVPDEVEFIIEK